LGEELKMFKYEIYYRIDTSENLETDSVTIYADSVEELLNEIKSIERRNTVIHIKNLSLGIE